MVCLTLYIRQREESLQLHGITRNYGILPYHRSSEIDNGKRKKVTESRLPNIFFAFGTENQIKAFVYDNANLPYLRFYYNHKRVGGRIEKSPIIIPSYQMESLKIICSADTSNTILSPVKVEKFEKGQLVRVVEGEFKGVIGRVARWQGQQRVGVVVGDLTTAMTGYVPSAFCQKIDITIE